MIITLSPLALSSMNNWYPIYPTLTIKSSKLRTGQQTKTKLINLPVASVLLTLKTGDNVITITTNASCHARGSTLECNTNSEGLSPSTNSDDYFRQENVLVSHTLDMAPS